MPTPIREGLDPPSVREANAAARGGRWWPLAISLGVIAAALVGGFLLLRSAMAGTTVTITNVGDRPAEGIEILAALEGSSEVRNAWSVGELRPGETREIEGIFSPDTNLAFRMQTPAGGVAEYRVRIYLGSPSTQHVRVEIDRECVARVHVRGPGHEETLERDQIRHGLEPWQRSSPFGAPPR